MRVVLKVTSSNENYNGGCEYALLDLTPDLASLALRRIAVLKEQKNLDPDIDETYYWAYFVDCYFDPWARVGGGRKRRRRYEFRGGGYARRTQNRR